MSLDESGLRLHAEQAHRNLPETLRQRIHVDDILIIHRSAAQQSEELAKSFKRRTALLGGGGIVVGFLLGSAIGAAAAWVLGAIGAFVGFKIGDNMSATQVASTHAEYVVEEMGKLISRHTASL